MEESRYDISVFTAAVPGSSDIYAGALFPLAQTLQPQARVEARQNTVYRGVYRNGVITVPGVFPAEKRLRRHRQTNLDLLDRRANLQRHSRRSL